MATPIKTVAFQSEAGMTDQGTEALVRLLVVDDDPDDFFAIRRMLLSPSQREFSLKHVDNFDDALIELTKSSYDVVLIDYFIGDRSGIEILEAHEGELTVPVIVLTGSDDSSVETAALKAGAFDFLDKNALTCATLTRSLDFAMKRFDVEQNIREDQHRLQRAWQNAEAAHISKSEFLEFLGGEVQTPLNAIIGFSQAMSDPTLSSSMPDICQEYLRTIHASGLHLHNLIEDLLDLSKTDTDSFDPRSRRFKRYRTWIIDQQEARRDFGDDAESETQPITSVG